MNAIAQASAAPVRGPKLDNRRVLAGIVDLAIVAVGGAVVLFAGDALTGDTSEVRGALSAVILGWALYYYFALESGDGQTVGKKLMKLRVVRANGSPVGMREVAVRTILRVVDGIGMYIVGLIVMLVTGEQRQRLGDLAAGTIVVDATAAPARPAAPVDEDDGADDSDKNSAEPVAESATITLPSRPAPPATLADLPASEVPAVPEMRPFPPVDEPVAEEPAEEPVVEDEAPVLEAEPMVEEPVLDEAVAEEPVVAEPVAAEPVAEEPLPEIASPSIQELAVDVATAHAEPAAEVVEAEPVVGDEPVEDGPVTVKSVETVSAIDLIMGGAGEGQDGADEPEEPASA